MQLAPEIDQRAVMQSLLDRGIATRRGIMCSHREPAHQEREPWRAASSLAVGESVQDQSILLPLFHQLSEAEQDSIVEALRNAVSTPAAV